MKKLAMAVLVMAAVAARADWPAFRGPTGDGQAGNPGLPLTWSETENVKWKTEIPFKGWSTPVVLGGQVRQSRPNRGPIIEDGAAEAGLRDVVPLGRPLRDEARQPARLADVVGLAGLPQPREVVALLEAADAEAIGAVGGIESLHEVDELALPARRAAEDEQVLEDAGRRRGRHAPAPRSRHSSPSAVA